MGLFFVIGAILNLAGNIYFDPKLTITQAIILSSIMAVLGSIAILTYTGVIIDFKKRRFKRYESNFGIKKGDWQQLPEKVSLEIIEVEEESTNVPNGVTPTLTTISVDYHIIISSESTKEPLVDLNIGKKKKAEKVIASLREKLS